MIHQIHIGMHTYSVSPEVCFYYVNGSELPPVAGLHTNLKIKSYDRTLHQSLDKIFSEHCLNDSDQIKEFLRGPQHDIDYNSIIRPILEKEPILSRHFSKEELEELSLLWIAVLAGYTHSAELLVRSGADINEPFGRRDPQVIDAEWTVLHLLIQMSCYIQENERLIRLIVDHGADLHARDHMGRTVLHFAALRRRMQMTQMLLEKGADVNVADDNGETALLNAVGYFNKSKEMVLLLMKHGADVFAENRSGQNVLHRLGYVPAEEAVSLAKIFIEKGVSFGNRENSPTPIQVAVERGHNELVKLYLDLGENVNLQDKDGKSLLYSAAQFGEEAVVKTLLERGANIDLRTIEGRTALHAICEFATMWPHNEEWQSRKIMRILLSAGADLLAEDSNGTTPFALIASGENMENSNSIRPMIEMLALRKVTHPSVELKDERIIEQRPTLLNYYRECTDEIDRMKSTRFIETCTFLQLLAKSYCQIAALMRNPKFESKFKQCDLNEFPIYNENLLRAFERAQKHFQPMLEQEDVISEVFYYTLPVLVVDKIVHYVFNCCENVK